MELAWRSFVEYERGGNDRAGAAHTAETASFLAWVMINISLSYAQPSSTMQYLSFYLKNNLRLNNFGFWTRNL